MKNANVGKICYMVLILLFGIASLFSCKGDNDTEIVLPYDEKIYWNGTIDDDFDGFTVVVVMDKNFGGVNKVHDKRFFGNIEITSIRDLTIITGNFESLDMELFRQILALTLPGDSKENVVVAIRHLEKIVGIKYAGPNHFGYPGSF